MKLTENKKEKIREACTVEYQNTLQERKKKGQFFTPPELIIKMIEKFDNLYGTFFDLCGGGWWSFGYFPLQHHIEKEMMKK